MVYIYALENFKSGGPELLHQLGMVLNLLGVGAKMVYVENSFQMSIVQSDVIEEYRTYIDQTECDIHVIDREENIVIAPEILFDIFGTISHAKKMAWWLSVDNYESVLKRKHGYGDEDLKDINKLDDFGFRSRDDILHLAQSYYAMDYLRSKLMIPEESIDYLSDYINDTYLQIEADSLEIERKDMVIFNPKKGGWRLKKLIDETREKILWVPLENLNREQMRNRMLLAKVYVDFGNHPGKDRIPREAAICGCCVITGRQGAAGFHEDVPIPEQYKIEDKDDVDVNEVCGLILDIFRNYAEHRKNYGAYCEMIRSEKERFVKDVMRIFC